MNKNIIHESEVTELAKPGRFMKWLITPENTGSEHLSVVLIRVPPGAVVRPAHAHPNGEEVIYIIEGQGRVYIEGEVNEVSKGHAVLFRKGSIHMLKNDGTVEMRVICFFAPPSDLSTYKMYEDIEFPK